MSEFLQVKGSLPHPQSTAGDSDGYRLVQMIGRNATVFVDDSNRINIYMESGGWIGIYDDEQVVGDIAPFAG